MGRFDRFEQGELRRNVGDTTPVGSYPPNGYGLYDMAGNVWEWCLDEYQSDFYARSPRANPIAGGTITSIINNFTSVKQIASCAVARGASRYRGPEDLRVASRYRSIPRTRTAQTRVSLCEVSVTP